MNGAPMATRRKPAEPEVEAELPSADEIHDVIDRWRIAAHLADVARDAETDARRAMVDLLHRAGLKGFSL